MSLNSFEPRYIFLATCLLLVLGSGCSTNKYLVNNETYLAKNVIKIEEEEKIIGKSDLKYELTTVLKNKPNSKFLRMWRTRVWGYHFTKDKDPDKRPGWFKRWISKGAETPVIFDEDMAENDALNIKHYLQNQGYFDADVTYITSSDKHTTKINYTASPKSLYTIDSLFIESDDNNVLKILEDTRQASFLKPGNAVSGKNYDWEKNRITVLLRNKGYAFFHPNFIPEISADTTGSKVNIYLEVLSPVDSTDHKKYIIGDIFVYPDFAPAQNLNPKNDSLINGIHFITDDKTMWVKPRTIHRTISLRPGETYSQIEYDKTNKKLNNLGTFKFVSMKTEHDLNDPDKINIKIKLTPNKKYVFGADLELNNSNYSQGQDDVNLLGTALSFTLRNRNVNKRAASLLFQTSGGVQINVLELTGSPLFSADANVSIELFLPRFVDLGLYRFLNKTKLIKSSFYQAMKEKATTRPSIRYNYQWIINQYKINALNAKFGYEMQKSTTTRYLIDHVGINYISPTPTNEFVDSFLVDNPLLLKSFERTLITGLFLNNFTYIYNGQTNIRGNSWYFSGNFELSGLEILALDKIVGRETRFIDSIEFAKFALLNLDLRHYRQITPKRSLAFRVSTGIALPFTSNGNIPYIRQFYLGGPASVRGWSIRELGPGSYSFLSASNSAFFQAADMKFEFSAEYRFDLFWWFKGAVFLDGGNIWTLKNDASRPGSQISSNFYKEIAIGSGFGIRGDFSYFVIRLDMGLKMRNPFPNIDSGKYWTVKNPTKWQFSDFTYNLAIGYPF